MTKQQDWKQLKLNSSNKASPKSNNKKYEAFIMHHNIPIKIVQLPTGVTITQNNITLI